MKAKHILIAAVAIAAFTTIFYKQYSDRQRKVAGKAHYEIANRFYENSKLDSATITLDSLYANYSGIKDVIYLADQLKIRIEKKRNSDSIVIITQQLYELEHKGGNADKPEKLAEEIAVLKEKKTLLKQRYSAILIEEDKYSCSQCAVYMQNARR